MNTGSVLAQFTITLSKAVTEPVSVEWFTSDGTAKAGVDYAANKGIALFAPGETEKKVDILIYGRAVGTEDRSFFVEMLPPTNAILGAAIGECIIHVDTSGSQPVTQIIVPTGPQGLTGKSAYQSWLDTGHSGTESDFLEWLKPSPEEIAEEVAPLLDVGDTVLTAEGTDTLGKPDQTTVKALARRVAYAGAAKIATVVLSDGTNTLAPADLSGDAVDFVSNGFVPRILRSGVMSEPDWKVDKSGKLVVLGAVAGDVLYAVQYQDISAKRRFASATELADARAWVSENFNDSLYKKLQAGDFSTGFTVSSDMQIVYNPTDKHWYRYTGTIPAEGLIVSAGSTPDANWENIDFAQPVRMRRLKELSTTSIAGYRSVNIDTPISVKDTDNQGAKIASGVSITGESPTLNPVKTTKVQSAFRLDGDDITILNVVGAGSADDTNTSTSEFITSRMADAVAGKKLRRLRVRGADITGFTTGIALSGINGAIIQDVRARNMRYSPTGLNSAGGYLMVCGGNAKHVIMNAIQHQLVAGADRHTLYISAASGDTLGWSYWNVSNVDSDYSANSVDNKGVSGVPFAMSPIHVRNGQNLNLVNHMVEGYICSAFDYENQFGPINNTNVSNVMATDAQSYQNGTLIEQGVLRIGYHQYTHKNQHHNFSNFNIKMVRGLDNAGNKMAAGTDNGVWAAKLQYANFSNGQITTETGCAFRLYDSSYINIDNICDRQLESTSGLNSIYLKGCSNITIGNIQSNRMPTMSKERVYTIEDDCTEITCRFPRRVLLLINSSGVTVKEDRWDMLNGTPTVGVSTVQVPLKPHVSTNAKRLATVENLTGANVKAVRTTDAAANTLQFLMWDTSTNEASPVANANNIVAINFTC